MKYPKSDLKNYVALFPGQGSQQIGMGKDYLEEDSFWKETFAYASSVLGWDLKEMVLSGDLNTLTRTSVAQPAVVTTSYCLYYEAIREFGLPSYLMGHSLGEVTAAIVSGSLSFEDGIEFVKSRSLLMEEIQEEDAGFSGIVLDLSKDQLEEILRDDDLKDLCSISAYNSPGQFMVGGEKPAEKILDQVIFEARGQYVPHRIIPMKVNTPFHTDVLRPYQDKFKDLLEGVSLRDAQVPIFSTVRGELVDKGQDVKKALKAQLLKPVLWSQGIEFLTSKGLKGYMEVGPGDTMTNLVRESKDSLNVWSFDLK